jgi:hypothetical protein
VYKQITGDSTVVARSPETSIPHAHDKNEQEDDARAVCYRWSKVAVEEVNHLMTLGYTPQAAIRIMDTSAVREVVPLPEASEVVEKLPKEAGDGVDGVMYVPKTRAQVCRVQTAVVADGSLGYTSKGVPIRPRRHLYCKNHHAVKGENVVVKVGTGQQVCKKCLKETRRVYLNTHSNKPRFF